MRSFAPGAGFGGAGDLVACLPRLERDRAGTQSRPLLRTKGSTFWRVALGLALRRRCVPATAIAAQPDLAGLSRELERGIYRRTGECDKPDNAAMPYRFNGSPFLACVPARETREPRDR